ncbi:MAG: hypothetical protein H7X95_07765 [Deltaproteobacteria bacterium]|nr:hypothetical protein [Deltaproteobacteria bacterium]
MSSRPNFFLIHRRVLSSIVAVAVAAAGFTSSSCAAPRMPGGGVLRSVAGGYELEVLLDGVPARTFEYRGETHVLGQLGARYTLRIANRTSHRIEAVVSVDGRDAMDGKTADVRTKRGYLVPAWGTVDVDGWRLSRAEVAAFRFSSVADSYAARTGNAREVGVIGVAVFPERYVPQPRPQPRPLYTPPRYPRSSTSPARPDWDSGAQALNDAPLSSSPTESKSSEAPKSEKHDIGDLLEGTSGSRGRGDALARREAAPAPRNRPGLGTEFGEAVNSPIQEVSFTRANASHPSTILGARYNDREGLLALGIDVDTCCRDSDEDLAWRQSATPFPVSDRRYAAPPSGWHQGCCVR